MNAGSSRPRWLVLGGGAVVAEFYLPAFAGLGWLGDVWVADPSAKALARLSREYPQLKTLPMDFETALVHAHEIDAGGIIVALPNFLHLPAVTRALESNFDVLCEKPLALTEADCLQLANLAAARSRILAVGMTRRFLPAVKALRQVLDAGWLGEIQSIEAEDGNAFAWSSESGIYSRPDNAGVLANVGVHALDLIQYLFGALAPVSYTDDWRGGVEANVDYRLTTRASIPVALRLSYTRLFPKGLRIFGKLGEVQITGDSAVATFRSSALQVDATVSAKPPYEYGSWPLTFEGAMREEFCDFADAIARRRSPRATPRDARHTAALIDWAYAHHNHATLTTPHLGSAPANIALTKGRMVVTGGTGFVGGHLVEALFDRGHSDVLVPIRGFQRGANTWRFPARFEPVDLLDRSALRAVMKEARHVFHLAFGRDGKNASRVTIEGTQNVIETAIEAGAESVVVVSTASVFGDPGGSRPVDESFPYAHSGAEYQATKEQAERWALARAKSETRTRIVVLNPSCVYGPRGGSFTEMPARLLQDGCFCWIEDGTGLANYVYVGNLVDAILLAAASPEAHGQRFIVNDGTTTWRNYFTLLFGAQRSQAIPSYTRAELAKLTERDRASLRDVAKAIVGNKELWRRVGDNPGLAKGKAFVERVAPHLYERVKNSRRPVSQGQIESWMPTPKPPLFLGDLFGVTTSQLSSQKARHVLGWTPRTDLISGQGISRGWLADLGLLDIEPDASEPDRSGPPVIAPRLAGETA